MLEEGVGGARSSDLLECRARIPEIGEYELLRRRRAPGRCGTPRAEQTIVRALNQGDMANVRDPRPVSQKVDVQCRQNRGPEPLHSQTERRSDGNGLVSMPGRREIGLARHQHDPINIRMSEYLTGVRPRSGLIGDEKNQVSGSCRLLRAGDAFYLDDVLGVSRSSRVDQGDAQALEVDRFRH